ncbi:MAG: hypothetical protein FWB74_00280 [Defluviitaleaceae bacterium]|nr:hypothetical protein [Defluviitaleaceae bacterium]
MTIKELTADDFARAAKNPFFDKLCQKVEVVVRRKDYALFSEIAEINGETPENLMRRVLRMSADDMREHDDE